MFQLPRGTRDFTPDEMEKRRFVEKKIAATFRLFGYGEIQTPTFENVELFTAKSGENIINEIYSFADKGGRNIALRPELTAPVIRCYVERLQMEPKPLKLFYFGNCFRYDRPQKGRYREFWQAGCELIGANTPEAHAELIALAYTILKDLGLQDIQLHIGNLTIIQAMFTRLGLSKDDQKTLLPLIDKSQFDEVLSLLVGDLSLSSKDAERFITVLQTSDSEVVRDYIKDSPSAVEEVVKMEQILHLLQTAFHVQKQHLSLKMSIVRGLDYYKGVVFEIEAPKLGAEKQLCGGGIYDLVTLFGGTDVPTAGFAIGFDRTLLALETEHVTFPEPSLNVFVIPVNEDMIETSMELVEQLRHHGFSVDFDQLRRGIGKSLKYAAARHAQHTIIVGPKELEKDSVTLRDMKTGAQEVVALDTLVKKMKNITA